MTLFKCPSCNYMSEKTSNMKRHRERKHCSSEMNEDIIIANKEVNIALNDKNVQFICQVCTKVLACKKSLKSHQKICKGVKNSLECCLCHNVFLNASAKSRHLKKCKENTIKQIKEPEQNALSQQVVNNTTINGNQTINNTLNQVNNTNITILAVDPNKLDQLEFVTDHITNPELKSILKITHQDISDSKKINMLETYMRHLMTNPINKCIKKTNLQNVYSQIHTGDNKWETKHDKELYPKLTCNVAQGFSGLMSLRNSEKPMIKTERKLEELKAFLDYMSDEGYRNDSDPEINHQTHLAFKELVQRFKSVIFDVFKVNL